MNARRPIQETADVAEGLEPGLKDIGWIIAYCLRGSFELLRARIAFSRRPLRDLLKPEANNKPRSGTKSSSPVQISRIAYVLPRLGNRLPFRADCLVQAIAGRNWLASSGTQSEIQIGIQNPEGGEFAAHAWLVCDDDIVTGGDISRYATLLSSKGKTS